MCDPMSHTCVIEFRSHMCDCFISRESHMCDGSPDLDCVALAAHRAGIVCTHDSDAPHDESAAVVSDTVQ